MKREEHCGKKFRTLMELVFIFVIPFFLMCTFIHIEKTFVYDNSCNFTANSFEFVVDDVNFITSDNPLISLLEFVEDSLAIDSTNHVVKFINVYNVLWFLMFLLWHLVYGIVDGIVHLVSKSYATRS